MSFSRPLSKLSRSSTREEIIVSEHLTDLRSRVRLLTWVSGLCWTLTVVLGGLIFTGTLDWLLHFDDSGTRLVFGLALLGGAGWVCWRFLIAPLCQPLTSSFLAARVERRFPGLRNRVISAVEFLENRMDHRQGSRQLQSAVVQQAIHDLERIEAADVVESRAVRNITLSGLFVCVFALTMLVLHPLEAATSVQRLIFPFAHVPWPRAVELQLVRSDLSPVALAPDDRIMIARGDTLELYVINQRGHLPERVWFEYRSDDDGPVTREPLRQTTLRNDKGRNVDTAVINWTAVRGKMLFRAVGGDDDVMPFVPVEVVPPPQILSLQVTLTPPSYSQRPVETLPPGVGHVQGLLGTKVEIQATSDKPLRTAKLRIGDQPGVPLKVESDNLQFQATFEIRDALVSSYWLELTDQQGFTDREAQHYELRGVADDIPEVVIESPVADVLLTADAELPVKILSKDDLGLRKVDIAYQVNDEETVRTIPLFTAATEPADATGAAAEPTDPKPRPLLGPQQQQSDYLWRLASLQLESGARVVFRGEATDDYDLGPPHIGRSVPRKITIVSREEKQKELASRVSDLLDDLKQATELQQRARQQTQELQTQLEKVGEFRSQDLDQLQRAELDQRQASSRLTQPSVGVASIASQLLEEFRSNQLHDGGTEQRLERLSNELHRLERDELPDAEQALTRAQKLAENQASEQPVDDQPAESRRGSSSNKKHSENPANAASESRSAPADSESETPAPQNVGEPSTATPADHESVKSSSKPGDEKDSAAEKTSSSGRPSQSPRNPEKEGDNQQSSSEPDTAEAAKSADGSENEKQTDDRPGEKPASANRDAKPEPSLETALSEAVHQQTRSLETLRDLQESLSEWRDRRDVSRDLDSVIEEQQTIQKESAEIAQRTMTKSAAELTKQEKAELNKLASKQRKIAEQLDRFNKLLQQTSESIQKTEPEEAITLEEAKQEIEQKETASKMRDAADDLAENRMGSAAQSQQQALDELNDVERMMKRQANEDTEQFVKKTEEALQEFRQMRDELQDLADRAEELQKQPDSPEKQQQMDQLKDEQEELTERMAKAERKLERLRLHGPAESAHRARKRLDDMMKQMQDADDADEMQQAMDEALDDLEQVERELVLEKRIAQERLAFEQLEKIQDELKALKERQTTVIAETLRLQDAKGERENWSRGQLRTLKELGETERNLQHQAEQMQQQMASAEVFSLVLKRLARSLGLAADRLGDRDTSAGTQTLQQEAIRKIDSLLSVLQEQQKKRDEPPPQEKPEQLANEPQEQEEEPEKAQPPGESIPQLAQLKLLRSLQQEYLERTEQLESFRDKEGKLPEAMQAERDELAREQVELADYARNLVAKYLQQQPDRSAAEKPSDESSPDPSKTKNDVKDDNDKLDLKDE